MGSSAPGKFLARQRQCQHGALLAFQHLIIVGAHRDVQDVTLAKVDQGLAAQYTPIRGNRAVVSL